MIQPVVEGHGDLAAVPVLIRRVAERLGVPSVPIGRPIRRRRSEMVREDAIRRGVQLARRQHGCRGILIIFDADDDCAGQPPISSAISWAKDEAKPLACSLVVAYREYEAWFTAGLEMLRGKRGLMNTAVSDDAPEARRGAKEYLGRFLPAGRGYVETTDQPALTQMFDLDLAYERCRSFRKLVKELDLLLREGEQMTTQTWKER
ncbi:MAG TPA: DUF4276 family protein [Polyangia bacterium]|nr:DUF4276 family protein [Polyangia bacterium]